MKRIAYLFLTLILPFFAIAQPYSVIRQIGYEQGLPNNYVLGITQDKRGYLWFATEEGLSRYDGVQFVNYLKTSRPPLAPSGNELNCITDDPQESLLWIGTQYAGLNCYDYDNNTFKVYKHDKKDPTSVAGNSITAISPSANGNLWICTYDRGIDLFNKRTGRFIHYNSKTLHGGFCDKTWGCSESSTGLVYIGHEKGGLSILDPRTKRFTNYQTIPDNPNSLPGNIVRSLCIDSKGNVWLATNKGLAVFFPKERRFKRIPSIIQNCYNVRQITPNEIWVTPEFGGIAIINIHNFQVRKAQIAFTQGLYGNWLNPSEQSLRYIFKDKYSNVWLGSWGQGAFLMEHLSPLFQHYRYSAIPANHFLTNPSVMSVTEDQQGNLWMGTDGGGINVFSGDKRTAVYKQAHPGVEDNCMQAALCDSKGNLWFGIYNGGLLYFPKGGHTFSQIYLNDKATTDVRSLHEDKTSGIIWVGTSKGINLFDRDTHKLTRHINLPNLLVRSTMSDGKGHTWAGTFNGGIFILSPKGEVLKVLDEAHGFPTNAINQIYLDSSHRMWVGTSEGLYCFPNADFMKPYTLYNEHNGLDNTFVRAIIEDNQKGIWISTNQSICHLQPNGKFLCYNAIEGHPLGNFTDRSTCKDKQGILCFGSVNGLYRFNPRELLQSHTIPPVMISGLTVSNSIQDHKQDNEDIFLKKGKAVKLNYTQNTFNITFNTQDFAYTNRLEYIYKLEGLDDNWYRTGELHTVTFRNLPPGKYKFAIKARAKNQDNYSPEATLTIIITPPFYASWWAKTIYVLIVAASIWWLLRFYKNRVHLEYLYASEKKSHQQEQELNKERLQFYTNITHELRTPLTLIIGPIEDVEKITSLTDKDRHTVSIIRQSAHRLLRLINELLEFRKTETGNRQLRVVKGDIVRTMRETGLKYMELLRNPHVKFVVRLPQEPVTMLYDPEVITIILDNLISNAIKYTKEGSITLSAKTTATGQFEMQVEDTGYGISSSALPHIFDRYYQEKSAHQASGTGIGLALVRNLVNLHRGHISVTSEEGKGSCFTVSLSLQADYPDAVHVTSQPTSPIIAAQPSPVSVPAQDEDTPANDKSDKPTILIVEDNPDIRAYIAGALSNEFTIKEAENGKQGKDMAFDIMPDIIVSDILMPEMNGYEMCKALKTDVRTSHIPIILLTAKTAMEDKMEGYEVGADSYITKPFSATLLKSRIENLIAQRKALFSQINPLVKAGKKAMEEKRESLEKSLNKLDQEFLEKINTLIIENLRSDRIDINFLAENLCMSNSTLYRKMKSLTGISTKEYITRMRMKRAEEMLLEGKLSINEISDEIGFDNVVYFRQCFKKEFGSSPSEYLKRLKNLQ